MSLDFADVLTKMVKSRASDVHLTPGFAPALRVRGRIGLYSVMPMSEEIKELTVASSSEAEIAAAAREQGMLTLREDGLKKVRDGVTSIEEIARVSA